MSLLLLGNKKKHNIYGVSWNKSSSPILTRTDASKSFAANAGIGLIPAGNNFDAAEIYKDMQTVTDSLGNVFVRIPKFYIEKVDTTNFKSWRISKKRFGSAYLPWCFWNFTLNCEIPYIDVGKYNASLSGGKLQSIPNVFPLVNANIVNFRTYAQANGTGYQQLDLSVVDVLQTLFYVEFATLNSQSIMAGWTGGQYTATHLATFAETAVNRIIVANANAALYAVGQPIGIGTSQGGNQICSNRTITGIVTYDSNNKAISFDGAAVNIAVGNMLYNVGWENGFSSGISAKSGSLLNNTNGLSPLVYRGIENLYGNIYQFVDGINLNNNQAWIDVNSLTYASNVFANPYKQLGYANSITSGYAKAMGYDANYPFAEFPTDSTGGSTTYYSDYYYQSTNQLIAFLGGSWLNGSNAGLSCWRLLLTSSNTTLYIGGRLLKKPL